MSDGLRVTHGRRATFSRHRDRASVRVAGGYRMRSGRCGGDNEKVSWDATWGVIEKCREDGAAVDSESRRDRFEGHARAKVGSRRTSSRTRCGALLESETLTREDTSGFGAARRCYANRVHAAGVAVASAPNGRRARGSAAAWRNGAAQGNGCDCGCVKSRTKSPGFFTMLLLVTVCASQAIMTFE